MPKPARSPAKPAPKRKQPTRTFSLSKELIDETEKVATLLETNASDIARRALRAFIAKNLKKEAGR
jgi:hypothetical protein